GVRDIASENDTARQGSSVEEMMESGEKIAPAFDPPSRRRPMAPSSCQKRIPPHLTDCDCGNSSYIPSDLWLKRAMILRRPPSYSRPLTGGSVLGQMVKDRPVVLIIDNDLDAQA